MSSSKKRILLIGVDAAEQSLISKWANEGVLPTFRKLRQRGTWGTTRTPHRVHNGGVWPSIYTGLLPGHHQRFFYTRLDGYEIRGLRRVSTRGEAFWEPLSRAGKRVALVDVAFAPWSEGLNGFQISDWLVHDRSFAADDEKSFDRDEPVVDYRSYHRPQLRTYPASLKDDVLRYGRNREVPGCELSGRTLTEFSDFRDRLLERIGSKTAFCVDKMKEERWDLFFAVFSETHDVGHECWHIHDPNHPNHDPELGRKLRDPIRDVYAAVDSAIARLIEEAAPDVLVYVVCSHGMGPASDGNAILDEVLSRLDDTAQPVGLTVVSTLNRTWSRTPGPLRRALNPLRNRFRKKVHEALVGTTRGQRSCFAIPTNTDMGGVRVNLVGREPNGRIHPGEEYKNFCDKLVGQLLELVDEDSGKPIVRRVATYEDFFPHEPWTEDLYDGGYLGDKADLLIEWNQLSLNAVKSPQIGRVEPTRQNSRSGDHKDGGLVFAFGSDIGSKHINEAVAITDLAPTISSVLGCPLAGIDGNPYGPLMPRNKK